MISVFSRRPVSSSASRRRPICTSTLCSVSYCRRRSPSIHAIHSLDEARERLHVRGLVRDVGLVVGRRTPLRDVAERSVERGLGRRGVVRRGRRELGEHRLVLGRRQDEPLRGVAQHRGRVVGRRILPVELGLAVHREPVRVVARVHEGDPSIPPRRDVPAQRIALIGVDVLAEQAGAIASVVHPRGQRRGIVERGERAVRRGLPVDARGVRVVAREDARPARTTQRVRHERMGERDAAAHQFLLHHRHRVERVPALVVGDDQQHVGTLGGGGGNAGRGLGRRAHRGHQRHREGGERQQHSQDGRGKSPHEPKTRERHPFVAVIGWIRPSGGNGAHPA